MKNGYQGSNENHFCGLSIELASFSSLMRLFAQSVSKYAVTPILLFYFFNFFYFSLKSYLKIYISTAIKVLIENFNHGYCRFIIIFL